jgi:long-subunit acyl-CoA synthetase (AMP-forming)
MEYRLPIEQFIHTVSQRPNDIYLHQPRNREWTTYTWAEVDDQVRRIASGFLAQGLQPGDKVAIIAKNCAEWFMTDFALMMAGLISVPIYTTAGETTIAHVLSHSEAKAIVIGKLDSSVPLLKALPENLLRLSMPYETIECAEQWNDWLQRYEPINTVHQYQPEDMFTLVYTSGSTGLPKGVILTQKNVASSSYNVAHLNPNLPGDRGLSYLPLAHITERCVVELPSLYVPVEIVFVESLDTFIDDIRYARPSGFLSVPRLWTKFQSQILAQIPNKKLQRLLKIPIIGKMVAHKIRKGLGLDKARTFGSGTAPISPDVLEWFRGIGINISEGWGMTETAGASCSNSPYSSNRIGSIGQPLDVVEMKLSGDKEILIRGDSVFNGYYKNPEATAESFVEGWFRTGDTAEIQADGSWKIIGRIKEQFKTGKGKYVAPVPIESLLGRDADIEQVCVMGVGRKQPIALVVLGEGALRTPEAAQALLEETLTEVNSELESHQTLDHIIITESTWDIENDLLTPTLKLKRNNLEERYGHFLTLPLKGKVIWEKDL